MADEVLSDLASQDQSLSQIDDVEAENNNPNTKARAQYSDDSASDIEKPRDKKKKNKKHMKQLNKNSRKKLRKSGGGGGGGGGDDDDGDDGTKGDDDGRDGQEKKKAKKNRDNDDESLGIDYDDDDESRSKGAEDEDDEEDDDEYKDGASRKKRKRRQTSKRNKEGSSRRRQSSGGSSTGATKMSRGRSSEEDLKKEAALDEICREQAKKLYEDMYLAYKKDIKAIQNKRPAIYKVLLLPRVANMLHNPLVQENFLDIYSLKIFDQWLSKYPNNMQQPTQLRRGVLEIVSKLEKIQPENIQESEITQLVIDIKKNTKKQPEDRDIKLLAAKIFNHWARILNNTTTHYGSKSNQDQGNEMLRRKQSENARAQEADEGEAELSERE